MSGASQAGRVFGAVAGATAAGVVLSALLLRGERQSGAPSELVAMQRASLSRLRQHVRPEHQLPTVAEQVTAQGGHLALSALAGLVYAATTDAETPVVGGGVGFGLAFYVVAHWLVGPVLGVKAPEWQTPPTGIGLHALNHALFGVATAAGARLGERVRTAPSSPAGSSTISSPTRGRSTRR